MAADQIPSNSIERFVINIMSKIFAFSYNGAFE